MSSAGAATSGVAWGDELTRTSWRTPRPGSAAARPRSASII
jgi:hypothetical protein